MCTIGYVTWVLSSTGSGEREMKVILLILVRGTDRGKVISQSAPS
jgi:hypothetical protein